jgi:hypothetical protein
MKMKSKTIVITGVCIMVYLVIPSVFVYAAREDMSLTYLQMLPDESIKSLFDWCVAHPGEPVSTNPIIDVPNYVSCDEVKLDQLSRGFEKLADTAEQKLKDYCDGTLPPEEKQKFSTWFPNVDCDKVEN